MNKNKYFYRGMIRSVLSIGAIIGFSLYLQTVSRDIANPSYVIPLFGLLLAVSALARAIYYLIPFDYGSPWNGEMRWKSTAFEWAILFLMLTFTWLVYRPSMEVSKYSILIVVVLSVLAAFRLFGKIGAKRSHSPIKEDMFDRFLAKRGIF